MNEEVHCANCHKPLRDDELEIGHCSHCGELISRASDAIWQHYMNGTTIGKSGSEHGVIVRDEYRDGLRITLERDCRSIPFAITCGIGGWMVHTCYFSTRAEAESAYEEMKTELVRVYDVIPSENDPQWIETSRDATAMMREFVERFQ